MCVINKGVVKMAITPGSLDYLYYNGILDHIPYEAYEMTPGFANMNATQYLNMAKQGYAYNTPTMPDTFVRQNNNDVQSNYSIKKHAFELGNSSYSIKNNAFELGNNNYNIVEHSSDPLVNEYRQSLNDSIRGNKVQTEKQAQVRKGLIGFGAIALTLICLFSGKGKKVPKK